MSLGVFGTPVTYSGSPLLELVSTYSVAVPSGCTKLVVGVGWIRNPAQTITSVTYGGVAMTKRVGQIDTIDGVLAAETYTLDSPTVGTANVVVTFSGLVRTGSIACFIQQDAAGAPPHTASAGNALSVAVTSTTGDLVVDLAVTNQGDSITLAATAGQTQIATVIGAAGAGGNAVSLSMSWKAGASSSVTTSWTASGGTPDYKIEESIDLTPGGTTYNVTQTEAASAADSQVGATTTAATITEAASATDSSTDVIPVVAAITEAAAAADNSDAGISGSYTLRGTATRVRP